MAHTEEPPRNSIASGVILNFGLNFGPIAWL